MKRTLRSAARLSASVLVFAAIGCGGGEEERRRRADRPVS